MWFLQILVGLNAGCGKRIYENLCLEFSFFSKIMECFLRLKFLNHSIERTFPTAFGIKKIYSVYFAYAETRTNHHTFYNLCVKTTNSWQHSNVNVKIVNRDAVSYACCVLQFGRFFTKYRLLSHWNPRVFVTKDIYNWIKMATIGPKKDGGPNADFFQSPESLAQFDQIRVWLQKNCKKVSGIQWKRLQYEALTVT